MRPRVPPGRPQIEKTFESFFTQRGLPFKGTDFTGRSDYGPFIAVGIPAGGLFTGAEGIKTAQEAALWGGTAGEQYDPCYHLACDTFANNNNTALDVNSDAMAFATLKYAMNTQDVNGQKGKGNFKVKMNGTAVLPGAIAQTSTGLPVDGNRRAARAALFHARDERTACGPRVTSGRACGRNSVYRNSASIRSSAIVNGACISGRVNASPISPTPSVIGKPIAKMFICWRRAR